MGIVNDRLENITAQLRLKLIDFNGKVLWEELSVVEIPANSSANYFDVNKIEFEEQYSKNVSNMMLMTELVQGSETLSRNLYFFRPFKGLKIEEPKVEYSIEKNDSGFDIELKTDILAKNVYLQIGDEKGFFSDNYFDMLPNEKITITLKTNILEAKLKNVLTVRTLDGAF